MLHRLVSAPRLAGGSGASALLLPGPSAGGCFTRPLLHRLTLSTSCAANSTMIAPSLLSATRADLLLVDGGGRLFGVDAVHPGQGCGCFGSYSSVSPRVSLHASEALSSAVFLAPHIPPPVNHDDLFDRPGVCSDSPLIPQSLLFDSVLRKRKKKMNKHKYEKRQRKFRDQNRGAK